MRVSFNTSIIFSHHSVASKHKDVIIISRINDLDKCLNQNKENDENLFKNSNIKESEIILLQLESKDEVCQDY